MPGFSVDIKGLEQFKAKLDQLKGPAAKRLRNKALRAGAEVYKDELEQTAPVRLPKMSGTALPPGALQHDVEIHTLPQPDADSSIITCGPGSHTKHVARWLEWGHAQVRNTKQAVGTKGKGKNRIKNGGEEVGRVDAQPWLRPTYESKMQDANDAIAESMRVDLANVKDLTS